MTVLKRPGHDLHTAGDCPVSALLPGDDVHVETPLCPFAVALLVGYVVLSVGLLLLLSLGLVD